MKAEVLRQVANAGPGAAIGDGKPEDAGLTGRRADQPRQDLDGGRLAGPVRPEEAEHLAGLHRQREIVEGDLAAVHLADTTRRDGRSRVRGSPPPSPTQWERGSLTVRRPLLLGEG